MMSRCFVVTLCIHVACAAGQHSLMQTKTSRPSKALPLADEASEPPVLVQEAHGGGRTATSLYTSVVDKLKTVLREGPFQRLPEGTGEAIPGAKQRLKLHPWQVFLDGLLGWGFWVATAFIVVQCCYIRNYVPSTPVEAEPEYTMNSGHFGCFSDCHVSCCACLFPGIRWADTMSQANLVDFWPGFLAFSGLAMLNIVATGGVFYCGVFTICLMTYFRQELRKKLKMPAGQCGILCLDCVFVTFCSCCAIAQEALVVRQAVQHKREGFEQPEPEVMTA